MSGTSKKRSRPRAGTKARKPARSAAFANAGRIEVIVANPAWREASRIVAARIRRAGHAALDGAGDDGNSTLTILLTDDAQLRRLNKQFRSKNKPTNVLSFPASVLDEDRLGDVAMAYGVTAREARAGAKSFLDHAAHLAVHGVLHLLGYNHETPREANVMEPLETEILAGLGIADPYAAKASMA